MIDLAVRGGILSFENEELKKIFQNENGVKSIGRTHSLKFMSYTWNPLKHFAAFAINYGSEEAI